MAVAAAKKPRLRMQTRPTLVRVVSCSFHTNGMGKMAKSRSVAMLMAVLISGRDESVWYARKYLTAVEHADFLEDVHAVACTGAGRGP